MKGILLAASASLLYVAGFAQTQQDIKIKNIDADLNWYRIESSNTQDPAEIAKAIASFNGLGEQEGFELLKVKVDDLRSQHYRFQQSHAGVLVDGAQLLVHINSNGELLANGRLVKGITSPAQYQINESSALEIAKNYIAADEYFWEDPIMEAQLKRLKQDPEASYFPKGELVYAEKLFSQEGKGYSLNWKFDIYAKGDKMRNFVYVNAIDGTISFSQTGIHTSDVEGTAVTRYHGVQNIICDSVSPFLFELNESGRGGGVETLDMNESEEYSDAVPFENSSTSWDLANAELDDAALDCHWGMEMTYDYFFNDHGRDSYDDEGSFMLSYVHYGVNYFNAFWNGVFMTYGDGANNPLTSIDVAGHEFTHGVTGNSAGLIYAYESGALNESFSDIFGTAIEFYGLGDSADWFIGRENFLLRNMADPNDEQQPDTYLGSYWEDGEFDNGGVHINSGIQNYWYYLLSEGGSGINDYGNEYAVEGIGMEQASAIAYRNLTVYLTPSSQFTDARIGSVLSAQDLYGDCSNEVVQTLKAWHAVGFGSPVLSKDIEVKEASLPNSGCYLGDSESITVTFKYYHLGCGEVLASGSTIPIGYIINDGLPVYEEIVLTQDLMDGEEISYTFDQTIDLSAFGRYNFDFFAALDVDEISFNDTLFSQSVTHQVQLADEDIVGFESYVFSPDSFSVTYGSNAEAKISSTADNTGTKGFKMSGFEADIDAINWPTNENQNFVTNTEYISKICFCVDASTWNDVRLAFDMKQLHSAYWNEVFGQDMNLFSSSMRILVNGAQIGNQYHPTTYDDDPYLTYYVYLDDYAGTEFELCFQSKNFLRNLEDPVPGSTGDNTYLDNIRFFDDATVGVEELSALEFDLFPNPTNGNFFVQVSDVNENYQIAVMDALGKAVYMENRKAAADNKFEISLEGLTKGIYLVQIKNDQTTISKRIVLQ